MSRVPSPLLVLGPLGKLCLLSLLACRPQAAAAADCNGNGTADAADIDGGFSPDCNGDGVPDECEVLPLHFARGEADYPVPGTVRSLRAADLDGDGDLDLVAAGRGNPSAVAVLAGSGDGAFAAALELPAGEDLYDLYLGDADGDGDADLVTANRSVLLAFANRGGADFAEPRALAVPGEARTVTAGDLDGDGFPELIAPLRDGDAVAVFAGRGGGTYDEPFLSRAGTGPAAVTAADLDLDGDLDVATANRSSRDVTVLLNAGDGSLAAPAAYGGIGANPAGLEARDLDGDRAPDLLTRTSGGVVLLRNRGDGVFLGATPLGLRASSLAVEDLDADGDLDLAAGAGSLLVVRYNDGAGRFGVSLDSALERPPQALAPGDFDGDGDLDLAAAAAGTTPSVAVLENGSRVAAPPLAVSAVALAGCADPRGCRPHSGSLGDLDGDGDLDGVMCNTHPGSFSLLENRDGELVHARNHVFGGEHPQSVAVGDLDGDGDLDAVTVDNQQSSLYVHLGGGDLTFAGPRRFPVASAPIHVRLADLDGDGRLDAACANEGAATVSVLMGEGGGALAPRGPRDWRVRSGPKAVAVGDLDRDGALDLAVANSGAVEVSVLRGAGDGTFPERVDLPVQGNPNHIDAADLDADGDLDLVTASMSRRSLSVLLGDGPGGFAPPAQVSLGQPPYSVTAADIDGDGLLDLVTGDEAASSVSILAGRGDGSFLLAARVAAGTGLRFVFPGDLDADGDLDLITNDREGHSVTVIRNLSAAGGPDFLWSLCTPAEFHGLSAPAAAPGRGARFLKYLVPAGDDPSLLPALFQNTARYPLHREFLAGVFPERFPALSAEDYDALVGRRATRRYFAGAVSRVIVEGRQVYGFSVFADFADPVESLRAEEVRGIYSRLRAVFLLEPLAYFPPPGDAAEAARDWEAPGFPVLLGEGLALGSYQAYTGGVAFGRVRLLGEADFAAANASGQVSFQDILVLERAPRDIEGVVGAVITAEPQGELSHLSVRAARRGTPNAFVRGALEALAPHAGELVRLEVGEREYRVRAAAPEEAEAWWAEHRPALPELPGVDEDFSELAALDELLGAERAGAAALEPRVGGKAANLARLQGLLEGDLARYREAGFAVPVRYYLDFLRSNRLPSAASPGRQVSYGEYIGELLADAAFRSDSARRFRALEALRRHMVERGEVDPSLVTRIALRVAEVFGSARVPVRFRSSSNMEDGLEFNGAGLYDSTSACAADDLDLDGEGPSLCDPSRPAERGATRALKRVWSSLWNFRAYEERAFYGVPQELAAMAVLVTRAFAGERANGVAFTGNPADRRDRRYVVVAQVGEASVVSPEPGVLAEKNLLEVVEGRLERIVRTRPSSLVPEGTRVLADAELEELALLLWRIDREFPLDLGPHSRDDVLFDVEFKLERNGELAVKQVRPFLHPLPAGPSPVFELRVSPGLAACGVFVAGREPRSEYELKSTLRFSPGSFTLPAAGGAFAAGLVAEVLVGRDRLVAAPAADGLFRVTAFPGARGTTTYRFAYEQELVLPGGEAYRLSLSGLDFSARGGEPVERSRELAAEALRDELFLRGSLVEGGGGSDVVYGPCAAGALPLWRVAVELEDGTRVHLEERFRPQAEASAGPPALARAEVHLGGERREVTDYWSLVYAAERHNEHVRYWVLLEPPVAASGLPEPVRAVEITAPEPLEGLEAGAAYLGGDLRVLARVGVRAYVREPAGPGELFRRGDVVADGALDLGDAVSLLRYLFRRGEAPACGKAADADDDGRLRVSDAVRLLLWLHGGVPLAGPFAECGLDATADALSCGAYPPCR